MSRNKKRTRIEMIEYLNKMANECYAASDETQNKGTMVYMKGMATAFEKAAFEMTYNMRTRKTNNTKAAS